MIICHCGITDILATACMNRLASYNTPLRPTFLKRRRKRSRSICNGTTASLAVLPLSPRSGTTASTTATTTVPHQMLSGSPAVPAGTCLVLPLEDFSLIRESPPVLPLEQRYYRQNGTTAAPTVLPLPACRNREYSLVSLSHLPL